MEITTTNITWIKEPDSDSNQPAILVDDVYISIWDVLPQRLIQPVGGESEYISNGDFIYLYEEDYNEVIGETK
jgi:hypothetical protein